LARDAQDGGLYKLLVELVTLIHANMVLGEPSSSEEAYVEYPLWDAMEIGSKPIMESMIHSKLKDDGGIEEY